MLFKLLQKDIFLGGSDENHLKYKRFILKLPDALRSRGISIDQKDLYLIRSN